MRRLVRQNPLSSPILGLALLFCVDSPAVRGDDVRIVAWNVHEGFTAEAMAKRGDDFRGVAERLHPDVLVLEEVVSPKIVEAVRDGMGLAGYHVACSDFAQADEPDFKDFEVAVVSKYPITQVIEYDPTPDNDPAQHDPAELPITPALKLGMRTPPDLTGLRGFLWVRIDALKLTVIAVHLKSSRGSDGEEDASNAERREFVAAAVAECVLQDRRLLPDYTCVVAGDFNVGHSDPKNGRNLYRDDFDPSVAGYDGYDETHALLRDGLVGLRMRNLTGELTASTFPAIRSTPIDNIYVVGPAAARFDAAAMETETFGSDHRPVHATLHVDGPIVIVAAGGSPQVPVPPTPAPRPSADSGPPPLISFATAGKYVGRRAIVEFDVQAGSVINEGKLGFLNSMVDFRDPQNFTVVLDEPALKKFAAAGVADPPRHFHGKKIRVTGVIERRRGQYQIVVDDPRQIEAVPQSDK